MVIAKPGLLRLTLNLKVKFTSFRKEGGSQDTIFPGYRPQFYVRTTTGTKDRLLRMMAAKPKW